MSKTPGKSSVKRHITHTEDSASHCFFEGGGTCVRWGVLLEESADRLQDC